MKNYADNKRAFYNYAIEEELEAGVVLTGPEVKSIRAGHISLKEAYATLRGAEVFLTNAHISPYKPALKEDYSPTRSRKLLLKKTEVVKIIGKVQAQKVVLVPLKVYDKNGKIKVLIGVGKGKKKYDKREDIKKRDITRDVERELKSR
jgi:SsrA-binding protein